MRIDSPLNKKFRFVFQMITFMIELGCQPVSPEASSQISLYVSIVRFQLYGYRQLQGSLDNNDQFRFGGGWFFSPLLREEEFKAEAGYERLLDRSTCATAASRPAARARAQVHRSKGSWD